MNPSFLAPAVGNHVPELAANFPITSASNVYLLPSSLGLQVIAITAFGQSVFLPPAYSIVPGVQKFTIRNSGSFTFGIRDSSGTLLTAIAPNGIGTFALDNASNWVFYGQQLEPGLVTLAGTFSSTFNTTLRTPYVALDDNTSIHFLNLTANGLAAFVVDNVGKVITTPVTIATGAVMPVYAAFKLSNTSALVIYGPTQNDNRAVVVNLTGSSPNLVLNVNTPAVNVTAMGAPWGSEDSVDLPRITQLTASTWLATYQSGANVGSFVISVSGTTVTYGPSATVSFGAPLSATVSAWTLTATTILIIAIDNNGGNPQVRAAVATVTGLTVAYGAVVTNTGPVVTVAGSYTPVQLSATKFIIGMTDSTNVQRFQAITIAGTVVTFGATFTPSAIATASDLVFTARGANRYNPHLVRLGTNTALADYGDLSRSFVFTESAGTLTAGTIVFGATSQASSGSAGYGATFPMGTAEYLSFKQINTTAPFTFRVQPQRVTGTSVIPDGSTLIPSFVPLIEAPLSASVRMSNGNYALIPSTDGATSIPVFRISTGDGTIFRGNITGFPWLLAVNGPQNAQLSNRLVILGASTPQGNTIAAATPSVALINVEIAA